MIDNENTCKLVALFDEEAVVYRVLCNCNYQKQGIDYGYPKPNNVHFSAEDACVLTKSSQQTEDEIIDGIMSEILENVFTHASQYGDTQAMVYNSVFNQYSDEEDVTARRAEVVIRLREMGYKVKYECTKYREIEDSERGYSSHGHVVIDWSV